jgi:GT2 family glycosyltransferase
LSAIEQPVDLSIIIVSWNVADLLAGCLQSLAEERARTQMTIEVIVVDSASSDGSPQMVRERFPWVTVIACTQNVGFPRGNNMGLEVARGELLLLLNPDTLVHPRALQAMAGAMVAHQDVGLLGPQLRNENGTIQSSRRRFPTPLTAFFESTWMQKWAPERLMGRFYMLDTADDLVQDVDWVMGACMLTRRTIVDSVGGMDEAYFMYSEELDWCRRIATAGWRILYWPEAVITHYMGKSSEQAIVHRHIHFNQSKLRYIRKYHGRFPAALLRLYLLAGFAVQIEIEGIKGMLGHKRPLRWQRVRAYWQVLRSGLPPAGY